MFHDLGNRYKDFLASIHTHFEFHRFPRTDWDTQIGYDPKFKSSML